jgi:hypothetical protein
VASIGFKTCYYGIYLFFGTRLNYSLVDTESDRAVKLKLIVSNSFALFFKININFLLAISLVFFLNHLTK